MERLTERSGYYIRIKGCKTFYPNWKRKGAYLNNAIVQLATYEDAEEQVTKAKSMRLIDANTLMFTTLTDGGQWSKDVVYKADITNAHTVDPVHAAGACYCQECAKFRRYTQNNRSFGICKRHNSEVGENDFCSYGVRREG